MAQLRRLTLLIGPREQGEINHYGQIDSNTIESRLTEMAEKHDLVYISIYDMKPPFEEVRSPEIDAKVQYTMRLLDTQKDRTQEPGL